MTWAGRLKWAILLVGLGYSLYLQTLIQDEVFFANDLGLKLLQVKELISRGAVDLDLPGPEWARELWAEGLYPFRPQYVYEQGGRRFIQYPFYFPLLSAPFYVWLGWRGLYLLPLASVWAVWLAGLWLVRRLSLAETGQAALLAGLTLASPLTIYGATFWEHAPAVALAWGGLALLLGRGRQGRLSAGAALAAGGLIGLSTWLRPEGLALAGLVGVGALYLTHRGELAQGGWTVLGLAAALGLFLDLNALVYGHPLGVHGLQVVQGWDTHGQLYQVGLAERFGNAWWALGQVIPVLSWTFPLALVPLAVWLLHPGRARRDWPREAWWLLALALAYALGSTLLFCHACSGEKQWGPRYWLHLVPLLSLATALVLPPSLAWGGWRRRAVIVLLVAALGLGLTVNTWSAGRELAANYGQRIRPTLLFLRARPEPAVAVSLQHTAHELASLAGSKLFFLTPDRSSLAKLAQGLLASGQGGFVYLLYLDRPAFRPEAEDELTFSRDGRTWRVVFNDQGQRDKYRLYLARIEPLDHPPSQ